MKITLPLHQFPTSSNEQSDFISNYFPGKNYYIEFSGGSVDITLSWPHDPYHYIDPNLQSGLQWWSKKLTVADIPLAVQQKINYQLSLNDSWTLYAWSNWLKNKIKKGQKIEKVIILHIDDHRDCMSPLLFLQKPKYYIDPLTDKGVNMEEPDSIMSAIQSGAIAVGSFMPAFFHQVHSIEFRHLLPSHRMPDAFKFGNIKTNFEEDNLLNLGCHRPAMTFEDRDYSPHSYYPTTDFEVFLADIPKDASVLLHVDMDYFNNRFDGDSDWESHSFIHNPIADNVFMNVSRVFESVLKNVPKRQLEDITVALSPGFFPAELWENSISIIDQKFKEVNGQQDQS